MHNGTDPMFFDILTLFPTMFEGVFGESIIKRAVEKGLVSITVDNIRDYTTNKHNSVDDYLYGGDAGMLLAAQPVADAVHTARKRRNGLDACVVHLSPQGKRLDHSLVQELSKRQCLILLCGHYKGIDQRALDVCVDCEISAGDYVLSGGELPAMIIVDAVTRLVPGVLGNRDSAESDSFYNGLLEPPQYTRPEEWEGLNVPDVLLSGHHKNIEAWRLQQARDVTKRKRPDVWEAFVKGRGASPS